MCYVHQKKHLSSHTSPLRGAIGMAAIGVALWKYVMRYAPHSPDWFNRDRFVLSNGESKERNWRHQCPLPRCQFGRELSDTDSQQGTHAYSNIPSSTYQDTRP